jgi:hypothetical protein
MVTKEAVPMKNTFQLGERVRAAHHLTGIRRGTCGRIALVYVGATNIYDVEFDAHGLVRLIRGEALAPLLTPADKAKCDRTSSPPANSSIS